MASNGAWRGYFALSTEALSDPDDPRAPLGLLFDTRRWTTIGAEPVDRFRGFTYRVPVIASNFAPTSL